MEWSAQDGANMQRTLIPAAGEDAELAGKISSIKHNGTHGSYVRLIDGETDFILVTRAPSADEIAYAEESAVDLEVKAVALDAFVFLTHADNTAQSLSIQNIQKIYAGQIYKWSDAGIILPDESAPISAYQRNRNSGSQELMERLVMNDYKMIDAPKLIIVSMLGPFNSIGGDRWTGAGGDPLGLGYTVYFYEMYMFPHDFVKIISVDGVYPTAETIASGEYSLRTEVFVAIRGETEKGSSARIFRDWLFTEEGQNAVAESGYVPLPN